MELLCQLKINGERMDNLLSVIWQEGMFLNPQHFQQNTRYLESYCREVIKQSFPEYYGISELIIDDSLYHIGKVKVIAAKGIFPDRIPFILNHAITLDLMPEDSGKVIYLAIHLEDIKKQQISTTQEFRYLKVEENIIDNNRVEREYCNIELAKLNIFLIKQNDELDNYALLPIVKIDNVNSDNSIVLDRNYIPLCLNTKVSGYLIRSIENIYFLASAKLIKLANRLNNNDHSHTIIRTKDTLWFNGLNSGLTILEQYKGVNNITLKELYFTFISIANSLLSCEFKIAKKYPAWNIINRNTLLNNVIDDLNYYLKDRQNISLAEIILDYHLYTSRRLIRANILNKSEISHCKFILEIECKRSKLELRDKLPAMLKIAGNSDIAACVNNGLSGIDIILIDHFPEELTPKNNCCYFELNKNSELWKVWKEKNELLAIHIDSQVEDILIKLFIIG